MEYPLVSVIIVNYNHEKYIRQCVDSIIDQTYPNIEMIICDDASEDDSPAIIQEYIDKHKGKLKYNIHQTNTGLATMLNECMDIMSGKYVKCIAADDYLHPEYIAKCVAALESDPDSGMVYTAAFIVNSNSHVLGEYREDPARITGKYIRYHSLLQKNSIFAPSVLMRSNCLKDTGPYRENFYTEDYDRWLRIGSTHLIQYLDLALCYYRKHNENISVKKSETIKMEELCLKIAHDSDGILKKHIQDSLTSLYISGKEISPEIIKSYAKYPYRSTLISILIKYGVPSGIYKAYFKLRYHNSIK